MIGQYGGLLGDLAEWSDIQRELNCSSEEAWKIQGERADAREAIREAEKAAAEQAARPTATVIQGPWANRLADEYDAAQERGELAKQGKPYSSKSKELPGVEAIGLTHVNIHEARIIRDAEEGDPQ